MNSFLRFGTSPRGYPPFWHTLFLVVISVFWYLYVLYVFFRVLCPFLWFFPFVMRFFTLFIFEFLLIHSALNPMFQPLPFRLPPHYCLWSFTSCTHFFEIFVIFRYFPIFSAFSPLFFPLYNFHSPLSCYNFDDSFLH